MQAGGNGGYGETDSLAGEIGIVSLFTMLELNGISAEVLHITADTQGSSREAGKPVWTEYTEIFEIQPE